MTTVALVAIGAVILGLLGTAHLLYTFFSDKFEPRAAEVMAGMKATSPRLTSRTTMWRAWVGFNASHSLGAMLFAAFYLLLAFREPQVLRDSPAFLLLGLVTTGAYLALARRYWFRTPFIGTLIATTCFAVATIRALV